MIAYGTNKKNHLFIKTEMGLRWIDQERLSGQMTKTAQGQISWQNNHKHFEEANFMN